VPLSASQTAVCVLAAAHNAGRPPQQRAAWGLLRLCEQRPCTRAAHPLVTVTAVTAVHGLSGPCPTLVRRRETAACTCPNLVPLQPAAAAHAGPLHHAPQPRKVEGGGEVTTSRAAWPGGCWLTLRPHCRGNWTVTQQCLLVSSPG